MSCLPDAVLHFSVLCVLVEGLNGQGVNPVG
jgi:hypothetical protein